MERLTMLYKRLYEIGFLLISEAAMGVVFKIYELGPQPYDELKKQYWHCPASDEMVSRLIKNGVIVEEDGLYHLSEWIRELLNVSLRRKDSAD